MQDEQRFSRAIQQFDAANGQDPRKLRVAGSEVPLELCHARRLSEWVDKLAPSASEALRLAARCQHIFRWKIPRNSQPMGRAGYLKWRAELKQFHANTTAGILSGLGYDTELIERVQQLNLKRNLQADPECQLLEDALCLVFMEYQFDALIESTETEKMLNIVRKTWAKMSSAGHDEALKLPFSEAAKAVIEAALAE